MTDANGSAGRAEVDPRARDRLALVLDVDTADEALRLADELQPWFSVAKVGYQLVYGSGLGVVDALVDRGWRVFADLKLHDIPNTVFHGARALGRRGVAFTTAHASGGPDLLRAAVEGLSEGSSARGGDSSGALVLGVTVLTSEAHAPQSLVIERVGAAAEAGCGGVICAAGDLAEVRATGHALLAVTPGIRLAGSGPDDQARVATPARAVSLGADLLVVGRTVTAAPDRMAAARLVVDEVGSALR